MAWLGTYAKRIKLTTDNTKIDSDLSHFPLTVFLKAVNGDTENVFTEVTTNNLKIAVTKADGTTQLYVEIEKWDNTNQVGILHCGITGDTLASAADTDYYLYYDNAQADNTTYVGVLGSVAGESVWDSYNKLVSHQVDATTSTTLDSTSNDNDGTKLSADNPLQNTSGKIGSAQTYSSDYINHGVSATLEPESSFTISFYCYLTSDSTTYHKGLVTTSKTEGTYYNWCIVTLNSNHKIAFVVYTGSGTTNFLIYSDASVYNGQHHVVCNYDGTTIRMYVDGVAQAGTATGTMGIASGYGLNSGIHYLNQNGDYFIGDIDEIRYSTGVCRAAAWAKAEYNSLNDTLLTYGTEELLPTTTGAAFLLNFI